MTDLDLVIRAPRVVSTAGEVSRIIGVKDGTIVAIEPIESDLTAPQVIELGSTTRRCFPASSTRTCTSTIPGRTEWEGFASATRAAAAGGVTTLDRHAAQQHSAHRRRRRARGEAQDRTRPRRMSTSGSGAAPFPATSRDLRPLYDAGVFGFKCFLLHSGVDEFPPLDPDQLEAAMREIATFDGLMIVHAEDTHAIEHAPTAHGETYCDFLSSRPRGAENLAIAQVIELARWTGCRVHILHVSSSDALPMIATGTARRRRHHRRDLPALPDLRRRGDPRRGNAVQVLPADPRGRQPRAAVGGLRDGTIDMVVTDHSPSTPDLKCLDTGDFGVAWGGISSLQIGLSAVWTQARQRGFDLVDVCALDVPGPRAADRPAPQGPRRHRVRRRLLRVRARRRIRGRRAPASPQERDHAVRRSSARRVRCAVRGCGASRSTSTTSRRAGS